jgi:hypothetical protein
MALLSLAASPIPSLRHSTSRKYQFNSDWEIAEIGGDAGTWMLVPFAQ